jgi:membrane-associated phospholipid phosphatase
MVRALLARYRDVRFRLVDVLSLSYMAALGALTVLLHRNVHHAAMNAVIHAAFVIISLEAIRGSARAPRNLPVLVLRTFYPAFFFAFAYGELDDLQTLVFGSNWASDYLAQLDVQLFGVHPTVWVERWYGGPLDEILSACYLSYYVIGLGICIPWFIQGKRAEVLALGGIAATTYVVNYSLFYLIPAEGPRFLASVGDLHPPHPHGHVFAPLCLRILGDAGVVKAGCFPSSHVAGAITYALACARYGSRALTAVVGFFATGIVGATVYLGYHHAVDPIAGVAVGVGCYKLGLWVLQLRGEDPLTARIVAGDDVDAPPRVLVTES